MSRNRIAILSSFAGVFILLIASASVARAQCWMCVNKGSSELPGYRCVRTWSAVGAWVTCNDFGGTSYPCEVSGACEPTLTATVATVRPDGVMTRAVGLAQLTAPLPWLRSGRTIEVALAEIFPASSRAEIPLGMIPDAHHQLFSESSYILPNSGVASSMKCEGYVISRSYTREGAAMLRRESGNLTI